jgi:glyoxylase-like metal-dependent hydrolase (beta-lactamase superfamily II)
VNVGDIQVESILDGTGVAPAPKFFGGGTGKGGSEDDWIPHREFLNADGMLELSVGSFLVRSRDRVILVDLGVNEWIKNPGSRATTTWTTGMLLKNLAVHGLGPNDVTDVMFTHLHFDHVGWASVDGTVTFPNATYRCDARDWAHFFPKDQAPSDPRVDLRLAPVGDRWSLWNADVPILPGIDVLSTPGHTPGSTTMVISSRGERAMLLGDVVHCPVELVEDEWGHISEVDPALARRTRIAIIKELEGASIPAAAAHFPGMQFGRLLTGARGKRRWVL